MSFFTPLLEEKQLIRHDRRPLWKYKLSTSEFESLRISLASSKSSRIDLRDAALYYAEWWRNKYTGGIPSKKEVFESIGGNLKYEMDEEDFYKKAKNGGRLLNFKWIKKQNTLYFKSLLLQGGLPLTHISENHGKYKDFLLAVLEEQPKSLDDFIFNTHITDLLPISSQNDTIYENCFEIVKSILNDDDKYDELLGSSDSLKDISTALKVRNAALVKKERNSKPKNYWLLSFDGERAVIKLHIGLSDTYKASALANILGFEALKEREYQLFVNEELICIFRKLSNDNYKTDWYEQQNQYWNGDSNIPNTYIIDKGVKVEIKDFIQSIPSKEAPSLWAPYSDLEWRLVKGNGVSNKEAFVLAPNPWTSEIDGQITDFYDTNMVWRCFEGNLTLELDGEKRKYLSNVVSFDWTVQSQKPTWMHKSNMPVVNNKPKVIVYDENDKVVPKQKYKVFIRKHKSFVQWQSLESVNVLQKGCLDLKIERNGLNAYDTLYNIGNLELKYSKKSITESIIKVLDKGNFTLELRESELLSIDTVENSYTLVVDTKEAKLPKGVYGSIRSNKEKQLFFELATPFEGAALIDKDGSLISEKTPVSLDNLHGIRVLSSAKSETFIKIFNRLNTKVCISKKLEDSSIPLISYSDEIKRLYYLEDAMNHLNQVKLELQDGKKSKTFLISGFSHSLNVDLQFEKKVCIEESKTPMELLAIPLGDAVDDINPIALTEKDLTYELPDKVASKQFIVFSSKESEKRIMPRFVNTDETYEGIPKSERIENYVTKLLEPGYTNELWSELVSCFKVCIDHDIPFSTFDQLRSLSRNSEIAAKAFLFIGEHQIDSDDYIFKHLPELEKDLGFCFHWIQKEHWEAAICSISERYDFQYHETYSNMLSSYMVSNELPELFKYISAGVPINSDRISYQDIMTLRQNLGVRVLNELPFGAPKTYSQYNLKIDYHKPVKLLLRAPISVAESINNIQKKHPIWGGDEVRETIRRNIQYSQYLNQDFYNKVLKYVLNVN